MIQLIKQQIFLLLPFLLLSSTTHCMEKKNENSLLIISDEFMQKFNMDNFEILQNKQQEITAKILNNRHSKPSQRFIRISSLAVDAFYQNKHHIVLNCCNYIDSLKVYKISTYDGYSVLGLATIAVKNELYNIKIPHAQKREFIEKLLMLDFEATEPDKDLALIDLKQRCLPIKKNIYFLYCTKKHRLGFLSHLPEDLIHYVSILMLDSEKSLF